MIYSLPSGLVYLFDFVVDVKVQEVVASFEGSLSISRWMDRRRELIRGYVINLCVPVCMRAVSIDRTFTEHPPWHIESRACMTYDMVGHHIHTGTSRPNTRAHQLQAKPNSLHPVAEK